MKNRYVKKLIGLSPGMFMGLFLISLPVALLLLSSIPVTRIDTVIDVSFVLEPGKTYNTAHHTGILGSYVLKGVVSVEGEGIYFSKDGGLPLYVDRQYNFTIDPAYDRYFFNFDNTKGDNKSFVSFLLKEESTEPVFLPGAFFGWYGMILLSPIGLLIVIISYRKSLNKLVVSDRERETREIATRIATDPENFYERILDAYTDIYTGNREISKKRLERKIDRHMKLGLTREEAIIKVAEEEIISYQEKPEEVRILDSRINLKGVTIGGIGGSIFGFVGGFILGPVIWHTPAHTARSVYPLSLFCYILGGFISGFVAGKMARSKGIINGLCAGILNLIIWDIIAPVIALLIGLTRFPEILWLWGGISVSLPFSCFINMFSVLTFGLIGGFIGEKASLVYSKRS